MFEILDSAPREAKIAVLCFEDEFLELPIFYGCTVLMIDATAQSLTEWRWKPSDHLLPVTAKNYQLHSRSPLSKDAVVGAVMDADFLVVMTSDEHPYCDTLLDWLFPLSEESLISLTILAAWSNEHSASITQAAHSFNTLLRSESAEEATRLIRPIIEMVTNNFLVGVDLADVRSTLIDEDLLVAKGGIGTASGSARAETAVKSALSALGPASADDFIFTAIAAGRDLQLEEFSHVGDHIDQHLGESDNWRMVGCIFDPLLERAHEIRVVVIASSPTKPRKKDKRSSAGFEREEIIFESDGNLDIPAFLRKQTSEQQ